MSLDVPSSSPSPSPSRANYGFSLYLVSTTAFYLFIIWSLLPTPFFDLLYLPQPYWAVAIPIFCLISLALVGIVLYPALNLCLTPAPEEPCVLEDSFTLRKPASHDRCVPPMYDIPLTQISRLLYLKNSSELDIDEIL